jgi:hypothetical protein
MRLVGTTTDGRASRANLQAELTMLGSSRSQATDDPGDLYKQRCNLDIAQRQPLPNLSTRDRRAWCSGSTPLTPNSYRPRSGRVLWYSALRKQVVLAQPARFGAHLRIRDHRISTRGTLDQHRLANGAHWSERG